MTAFARIQRAPAISPPDSCGAPGGSSICMRSEEERRPEKRDGVDGERVRAAEQLRRARRRRCCRPRNEKARLPCDERVRLHVILAWHEHLDHRAVRDVEEDAQRSRSGTRRRTAASTSGGRTRRRPGSSRSAAPGRRRSRASRSAGGRAGRPRRRRAARRSGSGSDTPSSVRPSGPRVAWSASTAVSGSAIAVIWSPSSETDCPMKKRRKFGFVRRRGGSTAGGIST